MTEAIRVPLGRGTYVALIDAADLPLIEPYRWFRHGNGHGGFYVRGYLRGSAPPFRYTYMHQLIAGRGADHANGDGLDNQRSNLRAATGSQNQANRDGWARLTSSRFKGVTRGSHAWLARITVNYQCHNLGSFATEEAAARAYDVAAAEAWGDYARLNFPV